MQKLIVSIDSYSWIIHCAGLIQQAPKETQVIIVCKDFHNPIPSCPNLCEDSVHTQRSKDLFVAGKELGLPKISNLNYDLGRVNLEKLILQLQLLIKLGGVSEVYFQDNTLLDRIFRAIKAAEPYIFGVYDTVIPKKEVNLTVFEYSKKLKIKEQMVGLYYAHDLEKWSHVEKFY